MNKQIGVPVVVGLLALCPNTHAQTPFIPGGVDSAGLTNLVPDVALWYNRIDNYVTNGPISPGLQATNLDNWEPFISVLGDSTFLIGFTTFADDQTPPLNAVITAGAPFQRFVVAFQPAAGGPLVIGEHFFTDDRTPYRGVTNYRRQNGNPQRVAGDKRYGAVNFLTAAETSLGQNPAFRLDDWRWLGNPCYQADNAYVTVQPFALDPITLVQTPLADAFDPIYGDYWTSVLPLTRPQVSRTGGRPEGLDDGNFVVVSDDRTGYLAITDNEYTSFSIITPSGGVVKSATLVDLNDIWDNAAAYRGGFAIRVHNLLYFFDNAGTLQHTTDINASSGLSFGTGRGDASRMGSDIRSHYVYLAGQTPEVSQGNVPVSVAIWDSRTGNFVTNAIVTDTDPAVARTDRVAVAVDALDRFCVAYSLQPTPAFARRQIAARVMAFDGTHITYLTPSFFPFVNHENDTNNILGLESFHVSVAMTPREICIAAKGRINSTNNPAAGPDSTPQTVVYTVISHPAPVAAPRPEMMVTRLESSAVISWDADAGLFTLQSTPSVLPAAWSDVIPQPGIEKVENRYQMTVPIGGTSLYLRLVR
jgi:hypothetical protein